MTILKLLILVLVHVSPLWAQEAWEQKWNQIVEAAKKEGKVVVATSPDAVFRNELIPRFKTLFGVDVEHVAGRSAQMATKLHTERQAGIYSLDVFMTGAGTASQVLYPQKMLAPIRPLLVLPEVIDPAKWKNGKLWFIDPEEMYVMRVFSRVESLLGINADYVKPEEIRFARDLLNPKWRGKISTDEPTVGGSGLTRAAQFYHQMGEEFVRKLYIDQKPVSSRDRRQLADWLVRGTYPICLNCRGEDLEFFRKEGFKVVELYELSDLRGRLVSGPWLLTVLNGAPHPNAARLFVNWMASREPLETYSRGYRAVTLRRDVDESFLPREGIPRPGGNYYDEANWEYLIKGRMEGEERVKKLLTQR